jgi:D-inositol-3-phosphate glycosyltransferase
LDYGGPATYVIAIAAEAARFGHSPTIFAGGNEARLETSPPDLQVRRFPPIIHYRDYLATPGMFRGCISSAPDIVHANGYRNYQTEVAARIAKERDCPLVLTTHGTTSYFLGLRDRAVKNLYDVGRKKRTIESSDAVVAVSRAEVADLIQFGIPADKIHHIPLGVDPAFFRPRNVCSTPNDLPVPRTAELLLYVGRVHPIKGLESLVEAYAGVLPRHRDSLLIVAGPLSRYARRLRRLATDLGVGSRLLLTGPLPAGKVRDLYNAACCIILPSRYEVFGLVLVEAAACGKPVIATRTGGAEEIVEDGETGILIDEGGTVSQLREAIETLLGDSALRERMGRRARDRVLKHFTWTACAKRHPSLYDGLLGEAAHLNDTNIDLLPNR